MNLSPVQFNVSGPRPLPPVGRTPRQRRPARRQPGHRDINHFYAFDLNAWQAGTAFYHDLNAGAYVGFNLIQERDKAWVLNAGDLTPDMYTTPAALRAMGQ